MTDQPMSAKDAQRLLNRLSRAKTGVSRIDARADLHDAAESLARSVVLLHQQLAATELARFDAQHSAEQWEESAEIEKARSDAAEATENERCIAVINAWIAKSGSVLGRSACTVASALAWEIRRLPRKGEQESVISPAAPVAGLPTRESSDG